MQMSLNVTRKARDTLSWNGALNECERGLFGAAGAQFLSFQNSPGCFIGFPVAAEE